MTNTNAAVFTVRSL